MKKTIIIFSIIALILCSISFIYDAVASSSNGFEAWGFKKEAGVAPLIEDSAKSMLGSTNSFYIGDQTQKTLYLTFDCGYELGYTPKILDTLKSENVTAAFFVTGHFVDKNPDLIRRMDEQGDIIGNHTVNHIVMPSSSDEKITQEIKGLSDKVNEALGKNYDMKYLRPPKGEYSLHSLQLTQSLGIRTVFWSSAYVDWTDNHKGDLDYSFNAITSQFHNGSVILLHNTSQNNADVLERVIEDAKAKGFEFGSLDEIE